MIDHDEFQTEIRPGCGIYLATPEGVDEMIFAGMGPPIAIGETTRRRMFLAPVSVNETNLVTRYTDDEDIFDDYLAASQRVVELANAQAVRYAKLASLARRTDDAMLPIVSE